MLIAYSITNSIGNQSSQKNDTDKTHSMLLYAAPEYDVDLKFKICNGLRPEFPNQMPKLLLQIISQYVISTQKDDTFRLRKYATTFRKKSQNSTFEISLNEVTQISSNITEGKIDATYNSSASMIKGVPVYLDPQSL
ncbi:2444_t:CDS:2 [Gigaspora rosea]|nr:2444_t:CDS:2 [Gigaspora rosea]